MRCLPGTRQLGRTHRIHQLISTRRQHQCRAARRLRSAGKAGGCQQLAQCICLADGCAALDFQPRCQVFIAPGQLVAGHAVNAAFGALPVAPICSQPQEWQPLPWANPLQRAAVEPHAGVDERQAADFIFKALPAAHHILMPVTIRKAPKTYSTQ